jgi:hypothetical protein
MRKRIAAGVLGVCLAAGLFVLGRVTAHGHASAKGAGAAYARGLDAGRAQGVEEGRAAQETRLLPPAARRAAGAAFADGYRAGADDVFAGYDGGWSYAVPYVITLARGPAGITYRFASRTPLRAGVDYRLCPNSFRLCEEPHR